MSFSRRGKNIDCCYPNYFGGQPEEQGSFWASSSKNNSSTYHSTHTPVSVSFHYVCELKTNNCWQIPCLISAKFLNSEILALTHPKIQHVSSDSEETLVILFVLPVQTVFQNICMAPKKFSLLIFSVKKIIMLNI